MCVSRHEKMTTTHHTRPPPNNLAIVHLKYKTSKIIVKRSKKVPKQKLETKENFEKYKSQRN